MITTLKVSPRFNKIDTYRFYDITHQKRFLKWWKFMLMEGIHEASGYLALALLGVVLATGLCISLPKILKSPEGAKPYKLHKAVSGLFIATLLTHAATTEVVNGYFTSGAFLMGLTLAIALSLSWFPNKRKLLLNLKGLVFLIGVIVLLVAHLKA